MVLLLLEGYEDEEKDDEEEEISEENSANDVEDEVDNHDDHPRVSLRQDDINEYYEIKEEIGR